MTELSQGDAVSPALFNIALELVIKDILVTANGVKIGVAKQLVATAYADDVVIMAEDEANLKNTTRNLLVNGKKLGLTINEDLTKSWS